MTYEEYIEKFKNYEYQIKDLIKQQIQFQRDNAEDFNKLFEKKCEDDRKWFIEHFDFIWKHKDYLKDKAPFNLILIEFLNLYTIGGLQAGVGFNGQLNSIYLRDLIELWDKGFTYNSFPIIEYKKVIHNGKQKYITYIENNVSKTIRDDDFNDEDIIKKLNNNATNNKNHWLTYKTIDILKGFN